MQPAASHGQQHGHANKDDGGGSVGRSRKETRNWRLEKEWDAESIIAGLQQQYDSVGPRRTVRGVASLSHAGEGDLAFCAWEGDKAVAAIAGSKAGIILCRDSLKGKVSNPHSQLIFLDNPRYAFVRFVNRARQQGDSSSQQQKEGFVSPMAAIADSAEIGEGCHIGPLTIIGEGCRIGKNVVIEGRVSLQNCDIGDDCVIQSGVAIGSDGFAYERHPDGNLERFPHFARVVIGNRVEICSNVSIARGSLTDTVIGDGTKLDALVHIAHNVRIGRLCQLAAGTIIGGSTQVGDSCWTGLNSTLKNGIKVGSGVLVGAGACVIADVPDGDIVAGVPAKSIKQKVTSNELFIMTGNTGAAKS
ncbi:MAG: UDP-3-O-(3-hydroxymyristoyl)glucosamine N-acyltransferase [Thermoproteota archaeon]